MSHGLTSVLEMAFAHGVWVAYRAWISLRIGAIMRRRIDVAVLEPCSVLPLRAYGVPRGECVKLGNDVPPLVGDGGGHIYGWDASVPLTDVRRQRLLLMADLCFFGGFF